MRKKSSILSAALVFAMLLSMFAVSASAEEANISGSKASAGAASGEDKSAADFSWDNATVYFLLTDRFRNGDTSNDHSYGRTLDASGKPISGWDTSPTTFHGGDFAGITQSIEEGYFDDLGVNALWISAPYEQIHGYCDSGTGLAHYSYHGYYVLDYTESDLNFGTKEEFETLVDTAHEHGLRVVLDIVMNHAGFNNVADMEAYNYGTLLDGALDFKYKLENISDVNNHIDYSTSASDWGRWWGNDWIRSGLPGYDLSGTGDSECISSVSGLPDFRTESTKSVSIPEFLKTKWTSEGTYSEKIAKYGSTNTVTGYISSWLSEWVREYGVDGFRCDTAKHVEKASWNKLKTACVSALKEWRANNPNKPGADWDEDFWMTGEVWDHGVDYDAYYTEGGFDSLINFGTCGGGSLASGSLASMYSGYAASINSKDDFNVLSFVSSHDEVLANQSQDMYYIGSAFLLLPGAVQIYYGDESGRGMVSGMSFDGYGGAGHSLRSDMNWSSLDEDLIAHWQKVGTFRNNHIAVGAGDNTALSATSGVAFGRTYSKNGIIDKAAGVVGAGANTDVEIDVSAIWEDGTTLINAYDGESSSTVSGGKVTFNSGAHGTILLEEGEPDPVTALVKGESPFETTTELTVTLDGVDSAVLTVEGIRKYTVKNGSKVTIGDAAYPGDTVTVTLTFNHPEKGEVTKKFTFKKKDDGTSSTRSDKAIVHVYTSVSNAHIYAWQGDGDTATKLVGDWPGKALSSKDSDGWFVENLSDTTSSFNIIINAGSGGDQSGDITGLKGETWVVADSTSSVKTFTDKREAFKAAGFDVPTSDFDALKQACREIKLLDPAEYTASSLNAALAKVAEADKLIALGEDNADPAAVTAIYKEVLAAKAALVRGQGGTDTDTDTATDTDTTTDTDTDTDTDSATDTDSDSDIGFDIGDVNMDGKLSLKDASLIQRSTLGMESLNKDQEFLADVDGDGRVTMKDASSVQKAVTQLKVS